MLSPWISTLHSLRSPPSTMSEKESSPLTSDLSEVDDFLDDEDDEEEFRPKGGPKSAASKKKKAAAKSAAVKAASAAKPQLKGKAIAGKASAPLASPLRRKEVGPQPKYVLTDETTKSMDPEIKTNWEIAVSRSFIWWGLPWSLRVAW